MIYKLATLLFVLITLSSCSCFTRPVSNADAIHAPIESFFDTCYLQPGPKTGEVTIKRDSGFAGCRQLFRVFVDGQPVADLMPSQKIVLYLSEGDHVLSAWPSFEKKGQGLHEVRAVVKAGTQTSYRIGVEHGFNLFISPTAF